MNTIELNSIIATDCFGILETTRQERRKAFYKCRKTRKGRALLREQISENKAILNKYK